MGEYRVNKPAVYKLEKTIHTAKPAGHLILLHSIPVNIFLRQSAAFAQHSLHFKLYLVLLLCFIGAAAIRNRCVPFYFNPLQFCIPVTPFPTP